MSKVPTFFHHRQSDRFDLGNVNALSEMTIARGGNGMMSGPISDVLCGFSGSGIDICMRPHGSRAEIRAAAFSSIHLTEIHVLVRDNPMREIF